MPYGHAPRKQTLLRKYADWKPHLGVCGSARTASWAETFVDRLRTFSLPGIVCIVTVK